MAVGLALVGIASLWVSHYRSLRRVERAYAATKTSLQQSEQERERFRAENGRLRTERDALREESERNQALQAYFDQMERLLLDKERPLSESQPDDAVRTLARARTLAVLEMLGPRQKRSVLRFLQEQRLIGEYHTIVFLSGADFSDADLVDTNLVDTNLTGVNFGGADLTGAQFSRWGGSAEAVFEAIDRSLPLGNFEEPMGAAELSNCNFRGAVLKKANLGGCNTGFSDFEDAVLDRADLRDTSLSFARNLTQEQVEQAYGSYKHEAVGDTTLPEGLKAPDAWLISIDEQKREKGDVAYLP
jgi:uncharacterized protein YjbI with pentapeptide repeats